MPAAPWDNPDLDDFEYRQDALEGAGDWADSELEWSPMDQFDELFEPTPAASISSRRQRDLPELVAPLAKRKRFRLLEHYRGQTYVRSEAGWELDGAAFTFEPITGRLEANLLTRLAQEDRDERDPGDMVRRAWFALALDHLNRATDLARRALRLVVQPPDPRAAGNVLQIAWRAEGLAAAAMLSSALRQTGDSAQALDETEILSGLPSPPLMTSRAAAMCDVGRWDEARELALQARDIQASEEVMNVLGRIDRHFAGAPLAAQR